MKPYRDYTQQRAVGSVQKEWKQMARLALLIRTANVAPDWADEKEKEFTGIYKRLLEDPIEELRRQAG